MKIQKSVRRAIAWVVAVTVLAQATACSYVPARPDERTCAQEKAETLASAKDPARSQQAIFFNVTVDGRWRCAAVVAKNYYSVDIFVTWSDGTTEKYKDIFLVTTEPGRQYSVMAYEIGAGSAPTTATLIELITPETSGTTFATTSDTPRSVGQAAAGGFAIALFLPIWLPLLIVTAPITLPLIIIGKERKKANPEQGRRNTDCCYVWIEDAETQETIHGTAPSAR